MKNTCISRQVLRGVIAALLCCGLTVHAGSLVSDAPATSDINGLAAFTSSSPGSLTVTFYRQSPSSMPRYNAATIAASTSSGDSAFAGNYTASGVEAVSFNILAESTVAEAVDVRLVLRSRVSGRVWRNESVTASAVAGVTVANQVSFERSSGWTRDGGGDLDAMWAEDLQSVEVIGVRLAQPALEAMSYTLSDFTISGSTFGSTPAMLTALEQALKDNFGVTTLDALSDAQKVQDLDGDGMTDLTEVMVENDDVYANSIFVAEIVSVTEAGILIKWPCVAGSSYTVMRADSLISGFSDLSDATSMPSTSTGFMTYLDSSATGDGPYFYKIRREP